MDRFSHRVAIYDNVKTVNVIDLKTCHTEASIFIGHVDTDQPFDFTGKYITCGNLKVRHIDGSRTVMPVWHNYADYQLFLGPTDVPYLAVNYPNDPRKQSLILPMEVREFTYNSDVPTIPMLHQ